MATFYLDNSFRVHFAQNEASTLLEWDDADNLLNGKCNAYIEGLRIIPEGQTWTRSDGVIFTGLMIAPAVDSKILEAAQSAYEQARSEAIEKESLLMAQIKQICDILANSGLGDLAVDE